MTLHGKKMEMRSIEEEMREVGIDPVKALSEVDRMTGAISSRNPSPPVPGSKTPRAAEHLGLQESADGKGKPTGKSTTESVKGKTFMATALAEAVAAGKDPKDPKVIAEAFTIAKKKRRTAAEKLASRLSRKKHRSAAKKASRMYRKRNKRKIAKRMKAKLKKFGGLAGLKKLHKAGKRIFMHNDTPLANLREDLNSLGGSSVNESSNDYEVAATGIGQLSAMLGEIFEAIGDEQSAETMYDLSDRSADLAEEFEKVSGDLSDAQEATFRKVVESVTKALRVYEGLGSPSLFEAIQLGETSAAA